MIFDSQESIRHPQYSAEFIRNDIALLKLKEPVPFNEYVRPACIRTERADVPIDTELIIAGWGSLFANGKAVDSNLRNFPKKTISSSSSSSS